MNAFIESELLPKLREREEKLRDAAEEKRSPDEISPAATLPHELEHYHNPDRRLQKDFWFAMAEAAADGSLNQVNALPPPNCKMRGWFQEKIIPLITAKFGNSNPYGASEFYGRLAAKCLEMIASLLPGDIVYRKLTFSDDSAAAALYTKIEEEVRSRTPPELLDDPDEEAI